MALDTVWYCSHIDIISIAYNRIPPHISYSIHQVLAITSGIILEGMPFLLLGTVISTIITLFIPDRWLLRYMKEDSLKSYGIALGSGLCLPVCDCATIPMFNALLQRGIPQHLGLLLC